MEWKIDLISSRQGTAAKMYLRGEYIGESREPAMDAARYLLSTGTGQPDDLVTTFRGSKPCLTGIIGQLARVSVEDNPDGIRKRPSRPGRGLRLGDKAVGGKDEPDSNIDAS